ncbi:hypothetical protein BDZ90DRAFT_231236 [Jaminaea rosea]|uniref:Uncharacterized protein n=1 Tax=Jaminaea rosea TaxID=1569628 RepID=A0A316UVC5_9BASI|nr:hypothetical protein BDZ90DRAFT_231236 [Jaminaea rosea]PWN29257.1 hypothetical protein BDZ90DRAFT_231236 [Jaminaea rosea]
MYYLFVPLDLTLINSEADSFSGEVIVATNDDSVTNEHLFTSVTPPIWGEPGQDVINIGYQGLAFSFHAPILAPSQPVQRFTMTISRRVGAEHHYN